jgi:hypothetical protein
MHHCTDKYRCIQSGRSAIPHAKFSQIQQWSHLCWQEHA